MNNRITQALTKLFERHRIVFWYDAKQELRADFDALSLPGIEKLEIAGNEFGLKYRLLREQPKQRFLLYRDGPRPGDLDNWLLDILLAQGEFRTDQVAIWLSDLELGLEFTDVVQAHTTFFQVETRRAALKQALEPDDTPSRIRLKMLAVCAGAEPHMDTVMEQLLDELAEGQDDKQSLIERCALSEFLWGQMERCYGYQSETPGIRDFLLELFKSCYAMATDGKVRLGGDAQVFLRRWKDSRKYEKSFETLSAECAAVLGIEQDLGKRDFRALIELDYFSLIDQKIISDLVKAVTTRTVTAGDVALWVRRRRQSHWYGDYRHLYEALGYAARFVQALDDANLSMDGMANGVRRYAESWYLLDQLYRKFTYHVRLSSQASLTGALTDQIENLYSNRYLLRLNDRWQSFVDAAPQWDATPIALQRDFFRQSVQPFLNKKRKVCVIISDALRYEVGDELLSRIRQEDRYNAKLTPMLSMLPSYTQLGMAALLPNQELTLAGNESGTVLVDGNSSQGTPNRIKILGQAITQRSTALKADELMALKGADCRTLVRDHDLVYVYHNRIDATGDKRDSEERVFEAAEETLGELIRLIKKLTSANASNLLVTADHGFIYQNRAIDESDFSGDVATGEHLLYRDRRFVLGKGLKEVPGLRKFSSAQLGLAGDVEAQIPKSINRLRLKGAGSRFVHGGASLQEVVIPVLKVNKKRHSDVSAVEVEISRGASSVITSGQLAVMLYQTQAVTDKVQARRLRAGIYTEAGKLISDDHDLIFDLSSDNPRERELQLRFVLTREADEANGQDVFLKLEERHGGTSHFKEYKSLRYLLRRSFTSDFDF